MLWDGFRFRRRGRLGLRLFWLVLCRAPVLAWVRVYVTRWLRKSPQFAGSFLATADEDVTGRVNAFLLGVRVPSARGVFAGVSGGRHVLVAAGPIVVAVPDRRWRWGSIPEETVAADDYGYRAAIKINSERSECS